LEPASVNIIDLSWTGSIHRMYYKFSLLQIRATANVTATTPTLFSHLITVFFCRISVKNSQGCSALSIARLFLCDVVKYTLHNAERNPA